VKLLPDTHVLMWAAIEPRRLSISAAGMLRDGSNEVFFSTLSIWEVAIKRALKKKDFDLDARVFRRGLLASGYIELPISGEHAIAVESLPLIHKDPFDRLLIAQATVEELTLLTSDGEVAKYPGPILRV
jgi:PIN domain nuclease of toxin-antitoxin system